MKIVTILGARPQFIKAATVSREFEKIKNIKEIIVHTGQHHDKNMSDIFFSQMHIPKPNYQLNIFNKTHATMTGQMMQKIEEILLKEKPDWVVVYGDTNSTLAGALVAAKLNIKLAHVEAGLRSYNQSMPEEINRILTDRVSNLLFCPTDIAVKNLQKEGYENFKCKIVKSGDIMYDGVLFYKQFAKKPPLMEIKDFILCTIHRAENTDNKDRLKDIFLALNEISKHIDVILPLHPRTKKMIDRYGIDTTSLKIIEPLGYFEMLWLLQNCLLVMTDSGGLQKEAYFFQKYCITLRDETEWVELVENGFNTLVGANKEKIIKVFDKYASKQKINNLIQNLYGDGNASKNIVKELLSYE